MRSGEKPRIDGKTPQDIMNEYAEKHKSLDFTGINAVCCGIVRVSMLLAMIMTTSS